MRTIKCATNMKEQLKALEMADYILDTQTSQVLSTRKAL